MAYINETTFGIRVVTYFLNSILQHDSILPWTLVEQDGSVADKMHATRSTRKDLCRDDRRVVLVAHLRERRDFRLDVFG